MTSARGRSSRGARGRERGTVLLVGNYLPSLAAARVLARAGYHLIAGDGGEYATVTRSRSCHEAWLHPPARQREPFMTALLGLLERRPDIGVILPLRPDYVALLATRRDSVPARVLVASPRPSVVAACLDKVRMHEVAREAGVPLRHTLTAGDLPGLVGAAEEVGYPCVVRPADEAGPRLSLGRKAVIVPDRHALERAFTAWPSGVEALMIQRYVDGPRHNVHFAARDGRILARFETVSPRTDRPDGTGLGVETISLPDDPRLVASCDALVARLGYTGVGLVQFLVPVVGDPHFLELNPRLGSGVGFVTRSGLDLVSAAVELAHPGGEWRPDAGWRTRSGRRHVWTSRDLYGLMLARSHGESGGRASLRWLGWTLRAAVRADMHATWSLRDPMPTLAIYADLLRRRPWRDHRGPDPVVAAS